MTRLPIAWPLAALACLSSAPVHAAAQLSHSTFVSFGDTPVGDTRSVSLQVSNSGPDPGSVTGVSSADPAIGIVIGDCGTIAPGGNCTLQLTYSPTQPAFTPSGTLTLVTNSVPATPTIFYSAFASFPVNQAADAVPGATLLFPYFEVDPAAGGVNTVLSWRNTGATAILGHVTVWSDYGIPVMSFNSYLTGFDVLTLDLRAMLVEGRVPVTASDGQDPQDRISPQGPLSQDINFASCNGELPYSDPVLVESFRADLQSALAGGPFQVQGGRCVGASHGDAVMRGYVTIDTVNSCTQMTPRDAPYAPTALTFQNVLAGEYLLVAPAQRTASIGQAVAMEADTSGAVLQPGDHTFYGTWNTTSAADRREPLPTTWAVDANARDSDVVVWRDHKRPGLVNYSCSAAAPNGFPLPAEHVLAFDNEEQAAEGAPTAFPLATQRVALGSAVLPAAGRGGWIYLGLGHAGSTSGATDPLAAQAHVSVLQRLDDPSRSGADAHALDRANAARHVHPN